jgi:two-component sensor histidine kinase
VTEAGRLAAVRRYNILDTPTDEALDRITAVAARLLKVPIAIISIVDQDRIWFKSRHGIDVEQVPRELGLCASCILQENPWIVTSADTDPRSLANSLVAGEAGIRFYLGVPLRTHDGFHLGALCVMDLRSRIPGSGHIAQMKDLAAIVMDELELRLSAQRALTDYSEELARRELREDHIRGLMRELAHRSKNLLAVVLATARHTAPQDDVAMAYADALSSRVRGLACTYDLIAEENWRGASLKQLAAHQVRLVEPSTSRVELTGPRVILTPMAAQHIGMALHELASNALKYGALSTDNGQVSFSWQLEEQAPSQRWLRITWSERHGPPVTPPVRKAFGHLVLERLAADGLGGSAVFSFAPDGVNWSCEAPASRIVHQSLTLARTLHTS